VSSGFRYGKGLLARSARSAIARIGREDQAREIVKRLREARSIFDTPVRRGLRDEHAMRVVLAVVLRPDSNAIDVGAHAGSVLESIVRIAPGGQHMAFEPIPALHNDLVDRFPGVDVRCIALSDAVQRTEFAYVVDQPARSGLRQRHDLSRAAKKVIRLPVITERLDDVLADAYIPHLIKIDVEGAELNVLQGAVDTLRWHRPFILFEHGLGGADLYGAKPSQVFDLLEDAGLRVFDLDGDGPYSRDRFQATFTKPIWNFLAAPGRGPIK
jgi:FkbM family methyltransferase